MTSINLFEYSDYRTYLGDFFKEHGQRSGVKSQAAVAVGMHTTYLSQILSGKVDLSPEQAVSLSEFLSLDESAADYFLLLVLKQRSGSMKLTKRIEKLLTEHLKKRNNIKARISRSSEVSEKEKVKFYSSPMYAAIHVLVSIPQFQKKQTLADALKIPHKKLTSYINELIEMGMVKESTGIYSPGERHVHLEKSSPLINKLHAGWRAYALNRLDRADDSHTHYSAVVSLSYADAEKVRDKILNLLKENVEIIGSSKEETAFVMAFDYFPLVES